MLKFLIGVLLGLVILTSCGKKTESEPAEALARAQASIDSRNYEVAITQLRTYLQHSPGDKVALRQLLHATAGAAGFEAGPVYLRAVRIEKNARKIHFESLDLEKLSRITRDLLNPLGPSGGHQQKRLNEAIELLRNLERKKLVSSYEYFKWGSLHAFRLSLGVRDLSAFVHRNIVAGEVINLQTFKKFSLSRLIDMSMDFFMIHRLYGVSFPIIRTSTAYFDRALEKLLQQRGFKLHINTQAETREEFFLSLIRDNSKYGSSLLKLVAESLEEKKLPASAELFFQSILDQSVNAGVVDERLKSIFAPRLRKEFDLAVRQSVEGKSSGPMEELLASGLEEIKILKASYAVLSGMITTEELPAGIESTVRDYLSYLDADLARLQ